MTRTPSALPPLVLTAAIAALLSAPMPARAQTTVPALTCFDAADHVAHSRFVATSTTRDGEETCIFKTPAKIACVDAGPVSVTPTPPGTTDVPAPSSLLCYQARCIRRVQTGAQVNDPFGSRQVKFQRARYVCVAAGTATTTTSTLPPGVTTTTTTLPVTGCRFVNGQCTGTCGNGMQCGAAVGTGSCECRSVSCGNADAPTCAGACSSPSEACVFNLTGCSCVRIP